jgi:hypothetical protein
VHLIPGHVRRATEYGDAEAVRTLRNRRREWPIGPEGDRRSVSLSRLFQDRHGLVSERDGDCEDDRPASHCPRIRPVEDDDIADPTLTIRRFPKQDEYTRAQARQDVRDPDAPLLLELAEELGRQPAAILQRLGVKSPRSHNALAHAGWNHRDDD